MDTEIFVATRNLKVFEVLDQRGVQYDAGLFTDQLCEAIQTAHGVIVDYDDLVPLKYSVSAVKGMLGQQGVQDWTSSQFLEDPDEFLKLVAPGSGSSIPPKRTIAFVSYSGGTGKTTLALDTALQFARATERVSEHPALLIEFTYGASALTALTGLQMPSLFNLVTEVEEVVPARHRGVTLIPMDYDTARDLSADLVKDFLRRQISDHILTIIDSQWPHGLIPAIQDQVDRWLIVATPRVDAVINAEKLAKELGPKAAIIVNQKSGLVDSVAMSGLEKELELPRVPRPDAFEGKKLGETILQWLYTKQAWTKKYNRPITWWENLFKRRKR